MSAWAYRKCKKCGSTVHINSTCKSWGNGNCGGDPWGVIEQKRKDIKAIDKDIAFHKKQIDRLEILRENNLYIINGGNET